jgi:hypothetical protein
MLKLDIRRQCQYAQLRESRSDELLHMASNLQKIEGVELFSYFGVHPVESEMHPFSMLATWNVDGGRNRKLCT